MNSVLFDIPTIITAFLIRKIEIYILHLSLRYTTYLLSKPYFS